MNEGYISFSFYISHWIHSNIFLLIIIVILVNVQRFKTFSLVVIRGHSWSLVVSCCHSWSLVVSRDHSCVRLDMINYKSVVAAIRVRSRCYSRAPLQKHPAARWRQLLLVKFPHSHMLL